ncbi:hypothetical protein TRICI_001171 [Trichomonascus ciferrii]|uniref:Zn(2)-C6 fungal-type domain-containing protein n=1 Tax=Trichomonascus ciferrii TaxID=44093 RepID=A0A642VA55_9ASCO|nr:hypothetical protein TRICI_001171 [Trichomonascus ciferrii]
MGEDFSSTWRKRQACEECRKNKVRCEFSDPTSDTCARCAKKSITCRSSKTDGGSTSQKRKGEGIGGTKYSWIERLRLKSRPLSTQEQKLVKISELEKVIDEASSELEQLKLETRDISVPPVSTDATVPPVSFNNSDTGGTVTPIGSFLPFKTYSDEILRGPNYLQTAIDLGLITYNDAKEHYNLFLKELKKYCPFDIDDKLTMQQSAQKLPLTTLCMVHCTSCTVSDGDSDELGKFLTKVIAEKIYVLLDLTLDVVYTMIMRILFIWRFPENGTMVDVFVGFTVIFATDLASLEDARVLYRLPSTDERYQSARSKIQVFLSCYICQTSIALSGYRQRLFYVIPVPDIYLDALFTTRDESDMSIVYHIKSNIVANEALETILALRDFSPQQIKQHVKHYVARLREIIRASEVSLGPEVHEGKMKYLFTDSNLQMELAIYECAINKVVSLGSYHDDFSQWWSFIRPIINISERLIDSFVELTQKETFFPRFLYFKPLQALTCLLRSYIVLWSHGQDPSQTKVKEALARVKAAWDVINRRSRAASTVYPLLLKVEGWMDSLLSRIAQGLNPTGGAETCLEEPVRSSALILNLVRELITHESEQQQQQPTYFLFDHSVDPKPKSQSAENEIEQVLKELFNEVM